MPPPPPPGSEPGLIVSRRPWTNHERRPDLRGLCCAGGPRFPEADVREEGEAFPRESSQWGVNGFRMIQAAGEEETDAGLA